MKKFFIAGTDTNVGKTLVSALLMKALNGYYWKPIQSGTADELSDPQQVQQWTGLDDERFFPSAYSFKASLSPDQAARLENTQIDLMYCKTPQCEQPLIIEGAGGVFVPLNQDHCLLDLIKKIGFPVILVARGTLGTINHTLLTLEALRHRQIPVQGVIFNGDLNPDNQTAIEFWGKTKTLWHVPKFTEISTDVLTTWVNHNQPQLGL